MVASARVAYLASRAKDYGVNLNYGSVDLEIIKNRKRDVVKSFRNGSRKGILSTEGLTLFEGFGRFVGEKTLEITMSEGSSRRLQADTFIINIHQWQACNIRGLYRSPVRPSWLNRAR
jgi:pyruvate/2-oxoglutarate dehydrogenase complex dihydrolipoamide dehydrogenase (E3) component